MKLISEYFNEDEDRSAKIYLNDDNVYVVRFLRNATVVKETVYPDNNEYYVEDAADNWVRGIMKI